MKAFAVLQPGPLTTIQDLGRYGYQQYGVPPSGAMDNYAFRIGNLLHPAAEREYVRILSAIPLCPPQSNREHDDDNGDEHTLRGEWALQIRVLEQILSP